MKKNIIIAFLIFFPASFTLFSQTTETITMSTYYPSPNGVYRQLKSQRMTIGDTYINPSYCWGAGCGLGQIPDAADLIVEGNVGIGTNTWPVTNLANQNFNLLVADGQAANMMIVSQLNSANRGVIAMTGGNVPFPNPGIELRGSVGQYIDFTTSNTAFNFGLPFDRNDYDARVGYEEDILRIEANEFEVRNRFEDGATPRLYVNSSGNVGIGTTSPQAKLDIAGNVRIGAYTLPSTDGTANQTLATNGSGTVSWTAASGGSLVTLPVFSCSGTTCNGGSGTQRSALKILTGTVNIPHDDIWYRITWSNTPFTTIHNVVASMERHETEGIGTRLVSGSNNSVEIISDYACPVHFIVVGE